MGSLIMKHIPSQKIVKIDIGLDLKMVLVFTMVIWLPFKNDGKAIENVTIIIKDNRDNIWFGSDVSLLSFKDGKLNNYSQSIISYVFQDNKENLLTISKGQGAKKNYSRLCC